MPPVQAKVELFGGPRDGEIFDLRVEADGWPLPQIDLPMPTLHVIPITDWDNIERPEPTREVVHYRRDLVSPTTLRWRYLWAGER